MRQSDWKEVYRVFREEHGFDNSHIAKLCGGVGYQVTPNKLAYAQNAVNYTMPFELGDALLRVLFMIDRTAWERIYLEPHSGRMPMNMSILFFPGVNAGNMKEDTEE